MAMITCLEDKLGMRLLTKVRKKAEKEKRRFAMNAIGWLVLIVVFIISDALYVKYGGIDSVNIK